MRQSAIEDGIRDLTWHRYVSNVKKVNQSAYRFTYAPAQLKNAHYNHKEYPMQITFPKSYPSDPPVLIFLERFYHLNVTPATGTIRMGVLENDWTPFLSLQSVMESLDQILDEPDEDYPADPDIQNHYKNDRNQYFANIDQELPESLGRLIRLPNCSKLINSEELGPPTPPRNANSKSNFLRQIPNITSDNFLVETPNQKEIEGFKLSFPSSGKGKESNRNNQGKVAGFLAHEPPQIIEKPATKKSENEVLEEINQMISLFVTETNEIEQQMRSISNPEVKSILSSARDQHIEMLKSLLHILEEAKARIFSRIKFQVETI